MRSLQEIFDVVIDNGYYYCIGPKPSGGYIYMCSALLSATNSELITGREHVFAKGEVMMFIESVNADMSYLLSVVYFNLHLNRDKVEDEIAARLKCLEIYRNWDKRFELLNMESPQ